MKKYVFIVTGFGVDQDIFCVFLEVTRVGLSQLVVAPRPRGNRRRGHQDRCQRQNDFPTKHGSLTFFLLGFSLQNVFSSSF
jgi:hypothetical protein